jgi:hypothetical protein
MWGLCRGSWETTRRRRGSGLRGGGLVVWRFWRLLYGLINVIWYVVDATYCLAVWPFFVSSGLGGWGGVFCVGLVREHCGVNVAAEGFGLRFVMSWRGRMCWVLWEVGRMRVCGFGLRMRHCWVSRCRFLSAFSLLVGPMRAT